MKNQMFATIISWLEMFDRGLSEEGLAMVLAVEAFDRAGVD